jgi:hypothetical protein
MNRPGSPRPQNLLTSSLTPPEANRPGTVYPDKGTPGALWRPIAEGALRVKIERAVGAIAGEYTEPVRGWFPPGASRGQRAVADISLARGAPGAALLHAYLALAHPNGDHASRSAQYLNTATSAVSRLPLDASLFSGFTGIAWSKEHLNGLGFEPGPDNSLDEIDDALCSYLATGHGPAHFDLVSGLVGLGVYAAERLPRSRAGDLLSQVVEHLSDRVERSPEGFAWRTPLELSPAVHRPLGPFDLGLAHGVPGVIALLGISCANGVAAEKARTLLEGAVSWLQAQQLPDAAPCAYPASAGPGSERAAAGLAWCYGDAGIASALLLVGRCTGVSAWQKEALALARRVAAWDPESSGVRDAALCHGAVGVAHIFNRLYQATADPAFAVASRAWLERALAHFNPGQGIGGFRVWVPADGTDGAWVDHPGLLEGSAGIGLALLASVSSLEPQWDRAFLLSARSPIDAS